MYSICSLCASQEQLCFDLKWELIKPHGKEENGGMCSAHLQSSMVEDHPNAACNSSPMGRSACAGFCKCFDTQRVSSASGKACAVLWALHPAQQFLGQVSFVLGSGCCVTFQRWGGGVWGQGEE